MSKMLISGDNFSAVGTSEQRMMHRMYGRIIDPYHGQVYSHLVSPPWHIFLTEKFLQGENI